MASDSMVSEIGVVRQHAGGFVGHMVAGENALRLEVHCRRPTRILEIVTRLRRMFDLDADPRVIARALGEDPALRTLVESAPGLRLPGGWEGFEVAVRHVLVQEGGDAGGHVARRLVERYGGPVELPSAPGAGRLFPGPEALADADLTSVGVNEQSAATVRAIAQALLSGRVDFRCDRTLEDFVARWSAVSGIRPEAAHDIALGALGHPDAFPTDRIPRDAVRGGRAPLPVSILASARAESWRPWRAYALVHLWHRVAAA